MQSPPNPQDPRKSSPVGPPVPEMVAATSAPFYIGAAPTQISLAMHAPTGPAISRVDLTQREVSLHIENVTCRTPSPSFRVYLNVPAGEAPTQHPELQAGNLGAFGLEEASDPNGAHGGSGKTFGLDVTDLFTRLAGLENWDAQTLRVSFAPAYWDAPVPQVKVGRVSLYFR